MKEKIENLRNEAKEKISEIKNMQELQDLKVKYLGKKSELTAMLKSLGTLGAEERPKVGSLVNDVRREIENKLEEAEKHFKEQALAQKLEKEKIDITLPSTKMKRGSKHPINRIIEDIQDLFVSMGYDVVAGPELETDEYCFERLNLPKGHPARDMQDSFYITNEYLLRTQTSSVQARTMIANEDKSPIRMIRPSYFPFTEPSYEVDVTCFKCQGKGCPLCKKTGWIELLGAGMVHPNVLKMNGYDPEKYSGFAFGTGIDRLAMFRYGITDMRYLYTNDIRFLSQFDRKDEE